MKIRYATWQAVSTKAQAGADKVSIPVQIEHTHKAGLAHGWIHVRDYTVPGRSRTDYISLNIAEKHIPQLHDMLEAAYRGEFDILIVYDLNRFRALMLQVFDALCDCNVQLYNLSQPREPVPPREYTQERKNELRLNVSLGDIISNNETSQIQRHYRDKMPRRITEKGLHAGLGRTVYGYRKPPGRELDRNAVLVQDPGQVAVIQQIRAWFFSGCSLTEIAETLNAQGTPSPRGKRWWYSIVGYILANPFYAGIVGFGYTHWTRNRRDGTKQRHKGTPVTNTGKHLPLWDLDTHYRILAELERRGQAHPGIKTRALSRLLHCHCGAVMWAQIDQKKYMRWRCSTLQPGHASLRDEEALDQVIHQIDHTLRHLDQLQLPDRADSRPQWQAELSDVRARKQRWLDQIERGALSDNDPDIAERLRHLNTEIARLQETLKKAERDAQRNEHTRSALRQLAVSVETLPHYYRHGDPKAVNADLHQILEAVHVQPDKTLRLELK